MSYISTLKKKGRFFYDSLYCKSISTKKELGIACSWYVDTSFLKENSIIYSGGVGNDVSFELELAKKYGGKIFLFDPSSTGVRTMEKEENQHPDIMFYPVGLSKTDGDTAFQEPANIQEGSFRIVESSNNREIIFKCKSIRTLMKEFGHEKIDLLKIDIEGFEYEVLESVIEHEIEIKQICVEFHHFFKDIPQKKTKNLISLLKSKRYKIIHKKMLDYTFVKNEK